jgi:hypothetical protein
MRRLLLFIVADCMVVGGLYWLVYGLFWSPVISIQGISGAVLLVGIGSHLLWDEFILSPRHSETKDKFIETEE